MVKFPYGTVLKIQREFSLKDIHRKMDKICELGFNTIVVWPAVFWWEDRSHKNFPFQTGIEILKYAEKIGLEIIMELGGQITSLEFLPDFTMKSEYLAVNEDGTYKNSIRNYDYINYFHPEVKMLIKKNFQAIARAYKNHMALAGYDIWNETMWKSYDRYTIDAFRNWLEKKYKTIDKLNDSWDRAYYDWSQVEYTTWIWASTMPLTDFSIFSREAIGMFLREWKSYILEIDDGHTILADNVNSAIRDNQWSRSHDDAVVAQNVDRIGLSFYVKNSKKQTKPDWNRCMLLESIKCVSPDEKFWVAEMQSHHQALFNPSGVVRPEDIRMWNWEAVAHGAKGIIYWKWEPFIKGLQTFGRGLVNHREEYMDRAIEAGKVNEVIQNNADSFMDCLPERPKAAILFDIENMDIIRDYVKNYSEVVADTVYNDSIKGLFKSLWKQNIPATFITPEHLINGETKGIEILFTTNQIKMTKDLADALKEFISNGGILVNDGLFGFVNDRALLYQDLPGGPLNKILGYDLYDVDPDNLSFSFNVNLKEYLFSGYHERIISKNMGNDAKVLASFENGSAAVILAQYGKGKIYNILTMFWYGVHEQDTDQGEKLVQLLNHELGLGRHSCNSKDIHYDVLEGKDERIVIIRNYKMQDKECKLLLDLQKSSNYEIKDLYNKDTYHSKDPVINTLVKARDVKIYRIKQIT